MDLTNITVESEYSDITKDFVSRTDPMQGSTITTETPVTIYVSLGPEPVVRTMPNVVGETLETARTWLEGVNGLNLVVTTTEVDSEETAGIVVYQSIPVGESVEEGTTVMLQVSNGSGAPSEESPAVSEEPSTRLSTRSRWRSPCPRTETPRIWWRSSSTAAPATCTPRP